jgi:ATP-dependent DNA helicase RecQ
MVDNYRSDRAIVEVANWFAGTITERMKQQEIRAVSQRPGRVVMRCHRSGNLTIPVAAMLDANGVKGSCCILTTTNEEALKMTGLLKQRGRSVRLIQSNEGFDLFNLAEMRYFVRCLGEEKMVSKIPEENWDYARSRLTQVYSRSTCLEQCLRLLDVFRENNSRLYRTDLLEYLHESRLEDYQQTPEQTILVSTIHKAKGHEFDTVYLILGNHYDLSTDAARRAVYVAMTRARSALFIHSSNPIFNRLEPPGCVERRTENLVFPPPGEILMQLTHRDVVLGYFAKWKSNILKLRSGDPLKVDGEYLLDPGGEKPICRFSQAFSFRLQGLREKHYEPVAAAVRFVVAWKGEKDTEESAVLLPDLRLKLREGQHPKN